MNTPIPFQGSSSTTPQASIDLPGFSLLDLVSLSADFEGFLNRPAALPPGIIASPPDFGDFLDRSVALPPGIIAPTPDFGDLSLEDLQDNLTLLPTRLVSISPDFRDFPGEPGLRLVELISFSPNFRNSPSEPPCLPPGLICSPSESGSLAESSGLDDSDIVAPVVGVAYFSEDDNLVNAAHILAGDSVQKIAIDAGENYDHVGILLDNSEVSSGLFVEGIADRIGNDIARNDVFAGLGDRLILVQLSPFETL